MGGERERKREGERDGVAENERGLKKKKKSFFMLLFSSAKKVKSFSIPSQFALSLLTFSLQRLASERASAQSDFLSYKPPKTLLSFPLHFLSSFSFFLARATPHRRSCASTPASILVPTAPQTSW